MEKERQAQWSGEAATTPHAQLRHHQHTALLHPGASLHWIRSPQYGPSGHSPHVVAESHKLQHLSAVAGCHDAGVHYDRVARLCAGSLITTAHCRYGTKGTHVPLEDPSLPTMHPVRDMIEDTHGDPPLNRCCALLASLEPSPP